MPNRKKGKRFAFYVSGGASRLIKLIESKSSVIEDTVLVINDNGPNTKLIKLLKNKNIQLIEINYNTLGLKADQKNIFISKLLLENFDLYNIDYCYCFGGRILKGNLLNEYKNKIINFHPSVLPSFPGVNSIDKALDSNAFLLGNTAHFIDEGVDTGPIIMQSIVHNEHFTTYNDILDLQLPMIKQIHQWLIEDRLVINGSKVKITNVNYKSISYYPQI